MFKHTNSKYHPLYPPPQITPWLLQTNEIATRNCLSFLHTGPNLLPSCAGLLYIYNFKYLLPTIHL